MQKENRLLDIFLILAFIVLFFYVLIIGKDLLIPFILALIFSFGIIGLSNFYKKIEYKHFYIPGICAMFMSFLTYIFIIFIFWKIVDFNIQDIIKLLPVYQEKISIIYSDILNYFHIPKTLDIYTLFQKINISSIFTGVLSSLTSIFSNVGIILFYVMFILLEYRFFGKKILLMFDDVEKKQHAIDIFDKIQKDIKSYFLIKTISSLLTGVLSYFVMSIIGLDFALFWAFLLFLLNYIPTIGSIIAVGFPVILALIQYETIYPFIYLLVFLNGIQILTGNVFEPKYMGNKLNLSPLVIIISLGFWGTIWGIVGMILAVPIMVIINIVLSKFESTRPFAILLSEKGDLYIQNVIKVQIDKTKLLEEVKKKIEILKKINR